MWTGETNRIARTNAALGGDLSELMGAPVRPVSGTTVYLRDIGTIESGTDIITAYAHVNGKRTVYIPVTKRADASTLAVISAVKAAIPDFKKAVPDDVDVNLQFDQSPFVTNSLRGLIVEGLLGACLTGLMVLIFLRDWRSAVIVVMNIPFALLSAVILLWATGQTINIMTLGGLALAVGVLVDEATVEIENIHTHRRGSFALHVLHPGRLRSFVLHGGCEQATLRPVVAGCGLRHDRVVPAVEQPGPGVLHVADARSPSRRRA
jgi:multidrug efflux pump subunit AcrB